MSSRGRYAEKRKERISISIDIELLKKIDEIRGNFSRSAYIEYMLRQVMEKPPTIRISVSPTEQSTR
jgi:metal-responsive CopG/Arc/MetJ family transcriptional regulator